MVRPTRGRPQPISDNEQNIDRAPVTEPNLSPIKINGTRDLSPPLPVSRRAREAKNLVSTPKVKPLRRKIIKETPKFSPPKARSKVISVDQDAPRTTRPARAVATAAAATVKAAAKKVALSKKTLKKSPITKQKVIEDLECHNPDRDDLKKVPKSKSSDRTDVSSDNSQEVIAPTTDDGPKQKVETATKSRKKTITTASRKTGSKVTKVTSVHKNGGLSKVSKERRSPKKPVEQEVEDIVVDDEVKPFETDVEVVPDEMVLSNMKIIEIINDSILQKAITFKALYEDQVAVIRLEKNFFKPDDTKLAITDERTRATRDFVNDIYSSYKLTPMNLENNLNDIKATIVWPANEAQISKYTRSEVMFFSESPDVYSKVIENYINNRLSSDEGHIDWVYNILEGKCEAERVILNDTDVNSGFVLLPDLKWTGDEEDLNLLAICHRRDIRSLRDLNDKHLILLKNILTKGTKAIKDNFKKFRGEIRSYVHYHPSFYHFHVHFKIVNPYEYLSSDRDHLLSTVINNIVLLKDYYKKSTLTYPLAKNSSLYKELERAERV